MTLQEFQQLEKLLRKWQSERAQELMTKYNLKQANLQNLIELDDGQNVLESCESLLSSISELMPKR